jgi:CHASE2 domain-containing sensor protein
MREKPTLRIPLGILLLLAGLGIYALGVAWASQWIAQLPTLAQALVYLVLGVIWLLPLRRFLIWMETGRWR